MNDQDQKEPKLMATPGKLSLTKTVESGKVKQNFTHGRSKTVTVEVRKTRTFAAGREGGNMVEVKNPSGLAPVKPAPLQAFKPVTEDDLHHLTPEERQARLRVLKAAEEQARFAPRDVSAQRAQPGRLAEIPEETSRQDIVMAPVQPKQENTSGIVTAPQKKRDTTIAPLRGAKTTTSLEDEEDERKRAEAKAPKTRAKFEEPRRAGRLTVTQALNFNDERQRSLSSVRRAREKARKHELGSQSQEKFTRDVIIPETITVQELANRMAERAVDLVKTLMKLGTMATVNQLLDADTAELIVTEFGHNPKRVTEGDVENILRIEEENPADLKPRWPVVTIMGHVDHGKTSLLDALRKTDVVAGEAGGITQHIGAYQVNLSNGSKITFLDTPGHEAFTAMRARGAKVTDIVVLVVAADDGIMAQTQEAISHAKAAGVPIIVAINKMDKPDADSARVKNELMTHELVPEEFGGNVMVVEVSAKKGTNLDKLEEAILLQSEVMELKANPNRPAAGAVVEAKMDRGRGVVATILVQRGTLKVGDLVVAGGSYGRVRALTDDKNKTLLQAGPSTPVEIQGLNEVPDAGDEFAVVDSERTAREITEYRQKRSKAAQNLASVKPLEALFAQAGKNGVRELPVIIKGDVHGSVEAIAGSLMKFASDEVVVRVLHSGVGAITESDVTLARATKAVLIGFNVRATAQAKQLADREKVELRYYSIIYNVVDDIKAALSGMLSPTQKEKFLGNAEIRQIFNMSKAGKVAGCMVTNGLIKRGAKVRLLRDNVVIHEGTLKTLKRFKDEVREVKDGFECGMAFENYEDIREGDTIEAFEIEEVARVIENS